MSSKYDEPWPDDVKLFKPPDECIHLSDHASCKSVEAFLQSNGLKYAIDSRQNAEHMSPSGIVPFIKCGEIVISELSPIAGFVDFRGILLESKCLEEQEIAEMRIYMEMIKGSLVKAEDYVTWVHQKYFEEVTMSKYSHHPWPLNYLLPYQKRYRMKKKLGAMDWLNKSCDEVNEVVETCFRALSDKLLNKKYFFGDVPSALDALVVGHVDAIMSSEDDIMYPYIDFKKSLNKFENIVDLRNRYQQSFFKS